MSKSHVSFLEYEFFPVETEKNGIIKIDLGREIAGFLKAEARGEKGKTLILRYGEELDDGGNVRWRMPYDTEKFKEKFVSEFYCQEKRLIKDRKASGHCSVGQVPALLLRVLKDIVLPRANILAEPKSMRRMKWLRQKFLILNNTEAPAMARQRE